MQVENWHNPKLHIPVSQQNYQELLQKLFLRILPSEKLSFSLHFSDVKEVKENKSKFYFAPAEEGKQS